MKQVSGQPRETLLSSEAQKWDEEESKKRKHDRNIMLILGLLELIGAIWAIFWHPSIWEKLK